MDITNGAGTAYAFGAPEFTPLPHFSGIRVTRSVVFCEVLCRSLFVFMAIGLDVLF